MCTNTLKQYSLWLTSDELSAKQKDVIGWIRNGKYTYTHPQRQATTIQNVITIMAVKNPEAAVLVANSKSKGSNSFIADREKYTEIML